jgi:GNAT superfamily N-acetyltransferase
MRFSDEQVDDGITIREFRSEDLDRVKFLFERGMRGLVPEMVKVLMTFLLTSLSLKHPMIMTAPLLAWAWQASEFRDLALPVYFGVVMATHVAWYAFFVYKSREVFDGYINHSIETDLSSIPSVYKGGSFIVATHKDRVVGMVGGEFKEEESKNHGARVYELRRMSVDSDMRGRGLGKRLIRHLEKELDQMSKMFLDCSNLQYPAHAMYGGQGFELKNKSTYPGGPTGYAVWRFEKEY